MSNPSSRSRSGVAGACWKGTGALAAIRILLSPGLAKGTGISVPEISPEHLKTLKKVNVYCVTNPDQAREYIGFKHINGPHKWDAIAKARFAADWYRAGKKAGLTIDTIARRLGDNHATVVRLVNGMFVLDQAEKEKLFSIQDRYPGRRFGFSHLYTALTRSGYRDFLGLDEDWRKLDPKPNPIPEDNLGNLKQVLLWLYGSKPDQIKPVISSQNPDLKLLGEVLANPRARTIMLLRNDLREAHSSVERKGARFEAALVNARQEVEVAMSQIIGFDPEDSTLLEIGLDLRDTSEQLYETMVERSEKPIAAKRKK
jgi:hypothetical protein